MTQQIVKRNAAPEPVSEAQSQAWLSLAQEKNNTVARLTNMELHAQSILLKVENSQKYEEIDEATAAYRKAHTEMVDARKPFTNAIDAGIVQPLMVFEKRIDPKSNELYNTLTVRSLELRKSEREMVDKVNRKNEEISRFKTHVENEFFRICAGYRSTLRKEAGLQYKAILEHDLDTTCGEVKDMLKQVTVPEPAKFHPEQLTGKEMLEIYQEVRKPDYVKIYNEIMEEVDKIFENLSSDKANKAAALQHQQKMQALKELEEKKELEEQTAVNTLVKKAETVVVDTPKIKKNVIVVEEETEVWLKSVMAAFIVNLPNLNKYIKVKSWSRLNVGQMAAALGNYASDTGATFNNLKLQEVEK